MAEGYFPTKAYGVVSAEAPVAPITIQRRPVKATDVHIEVKFAGICHSDIHTARGDWGPANWPVVVGHEIGGFVKAVGSNVTKFKVGDKVGVGCMVNSCRSCKQCESGDEQFCATGSVFTYNSKEKYPHCGGYNEDGGDNTYGGYSQDIVVDESFVLRIPDSLDLAGATPLMCAGITIYSPLRHYGLKSTDRLAVAGLGGLGHMAVKLGKAWGCHVTVLSRGTGKREDALTRLRADAYVDVTNAEELAAARGSFDFMVDTIAASHDVLSYMNLLGVNGKLVLVGASPTPFPLAAFPIIMGRKTLGGSLIGGVRETQEMLDFCGEHGVVSEIELVGGEGITAAWERTVAADVKYRFVIDTASF